MKEITLDEAYSEWIEDCDILRHFGIKPDCFCDFCEFLKREGYIII